MRLELRGRITRDAETGYLISECETLGIMTCGADIDDVIAATVDLIQGHFEAHRQVGRLEMLLDELRAKGALTDGPEHRMVGRARFTGAAEFSRQIEFAP